MGDQYDTALSGKNVLIIDDEVGVLNMLCDFVELIGGTALGLTFLCPDGTILRGQWDLALIDMMLTGPLNGRELALALRKQGYTGPIVGITASDQMLELARDDVFTTQMRKPLDLMDFTRVLLRLLAPAE